MPEQFRYLLSPLKIGPMSLRNRTHAINSIPRPQTTLEGVDTVVMVGFGTSNTTLYEEIKGEEIKGKVPEMYLVGDALAPRIIKRAVRDGHTVGRQR